MFLELFSKAFNQGFKKLASEEVFPVMIRV